MTDVTTHHVKPAERVYDTIFSAFQQQSVSTLSIDSLFGRFSADASLRHYAGKNPSGLCEYIRKNLTNRFAVSDDGKVVTSFAMQKQLALQSIGQRTKEEELASLGKSWSATSVASSTASKPGGGPRTEPFEESDIRERVYGLIYTAFMKKNTAVLSARQIFGYFNLEHECREEVGGNCTGLARYIGQNFAQSYVLSGQVGNEVVTSIPMKHYLMLHPDFKVSHSPVSEESPIVLNNAAAPSKNQLKKQQDEAMEERLLRNEGDDGYDISAEQAVVNAICAVFEAYRRKEGRDAKSYPPLAINQLQPYVISLIRSRVHHFEYFGGGDKRSAAAFVQQRTHLFSVDVMRNGQKVEHTVHRRMGWEAETMVVINSSVRKKSVKPVADLHNLWCHSSRFPEAARTHYGSDANGLLKFLKSHAWIFSLVFSDKHVSSRREVVIPQAAEVDRLAGELQIDDSPLVASENLAFPPKLVAKLSSNASAKAHVASAATKLSGAPEPAESGLKAYFTGDGNPFAKNPPKTTCSAKNTSLKNNDSLFNSDSMKTAAAGAQAQAKKDLSKGAKSKKGRKIPRAQSEASKVSVNSSVSSSVVCPPGFEFCDVPEVSRFSIPPTTAFESSLKDRLDSSIKSNPPVISGTNYSIMSYPANNVSRTGSAFSNAIPADKVPADPVVDSVTGLEDILRAFSRLSPLEAEQFRQKLPFFDGIQDNYAVGNSFAVRPAVANRNGQVFGGGGGGISGWQTLTNNQHTFDVNRSFGSALNFPASGLGNLPFVGPPSSAIPSSEAGRLANNLAYLPQTQPDGSTILMPILLNNSNFNSSAFPAPGVEPTPLVSRDQSIVLYSHSSTNVPLGHNFNESMTSSGLVSNDSAGKRENPSTIENLGIFSSSGASKSINSSRNHVSDFSGDFVTGTVEAKSSSDLCSNCRKLVFPVKSKEVGIQVNKINDAVDVSTQTVKTGPEIFNSLMEANGLAAFMMD